jgi:hypothetical protein
MFSQALLDPTAGGRARLLHEFPLDPRPILDPTDPRCGLFLPDWPDRRLGGRADHSADQV